MSPLGRKRLLPTVNRMPAMTSPEAIQRRPSGAYFHFYIGIKGMPPTKVYLLKTECLPNQGSNGKATQEEVRRRSLSEGRRGIR